MTLLEAKQDRTYPHAPTANDFNNAGTQNYAVSCARSGMLFESGRDTIPHKTPPVVANTCLLCLGRSHPTHKARRDRNEPQLPSFSRYTSSTVFSKHLTLQAIVGNFCRKFLWPRGVPGYIHCSSALCTLNDDDLHALRGLNSHRLHQPRWPRPSTCADLQAV